ncbi:MAG TPA: hypothetical protein VD978_04660 [Azospirillum sp.]|nr:hypothetical protein [Azospirillum sp.]
MLVVTDSAGLKVVGSGEWHLEKDGGKAHTTPSPNAVVIISRCASPSSAIGTSG